MTGRWELTEEQWVAVEPVLRPARREDNRGRPWHDTRAVVHGVLWVLGTGGAVARVVGEVSTLSDLSLALSTVDSFGQAG